MCLQQIAQLVTVNNESLIHFDHPFPTNKAEKKEICTTWSKLLLLFALKLICEHFWFSFQNWNICVFAVLFSSLTQIVFILHIFLYLKLYCKFSTLQKKNWLYCIPKYTSIIDYVIIKHQIYTQLCTETTT